MSYFRFREVWFRGGGWTRTTELFRGQIYSLLQLPLCDSPSWMHPVGFLLGVRADEGTRTPDRLITNQLLYQLSYIGTFQPFKQLFFLFKTGCKNTTFFIYAKRFFHFFLIIVHNSLIFFKITCGFFLSGDCAGWKWECFSAVPRGWLWKNEGCGREKNARIRFTRWFVMI